MTEIGTLKKLIRVVVVVFGKMGLLDRLSLRLDTVVAGPCLSVVTAGSLFRQKRMSAPPVDPLK